MHYHKIPNRSHNSPNRPGKPNQNHLQSQYKFNCANQSPVSQNKFDCPNQSRINFFENRVGFILESRCYTKKRPSSNFRNSSSQIEKLFEIFALSKSQIKLSRFLLISKWFLIGRVGSSKSYSKFHSASMKDPKISKRALLDK